MKIGILLCLSTAAFLLYDSQLYPQASEFGPLREIKATELQEDQEIEIDGHLNEPVWKQTSWQDEFIQLKPSPGQPAKASTSVAVACDKEHLYVAFRCYNPPGSNVNSKINQRDGNMDQDNAVTLYLDTFHTRRDCFYFSTNSLGTQVDGRIGEDGSSNDKSWDCVWWVKTREDSLGWTAEMKIPVSEIRFPEGDDQVWGINFRRNYPEIFETSFWTERDAAWRISRSGDLKGLGSFSKKFSASLYPYVVALNSNTPSSDRRKVYSSGNAEVISGADLRFNMGTKVNGNLTYNPDFATVEGDLEVINLTRYETFYPEKRLFFLEGAELFSSRFNVFHSRRIGDINTGLKTSGRLGEMNFAALTTNERATGGDPSTQTSVIRLQHDILRASNIGMIAVDRSWGGGFNRALSMDATINLENGFKINSQYVGSNSSDGKYESAYYAQLSKEAQLYNYNLNFVNIDPGFRANVNPVGFIQDDDRREVSGSFGNEMWIRKHGIDKVNTNAHNNLMWSHSGALRNVEFGGWVGVYFLDKWFLGIAKAYHTELFEKRFRNHTTSWEGGYNTQSWNNISFLHVIGRNFDSDFQRFRLRINVKPSSKLAVFYEYTHVILDPDPNGIENDLHYITTTYNFTPDFWLRLISQYSRNNERLYVYGLLGWRFSPPFGAFYLAYIADRFDREDDMMLRPVRERQGTLYAKLTVPLDLW